MSSNTPTKEELSAPSSSDLEQGSDGSFNGDPEYPSGKKVVLIMISIYLAMFLVALDGTIVATAVPKITSKFNSLPDVGWYASAYLLTACSTQLIFGRLYTFYSSKTIYLASTLLFEVGSALCGAAPSSNAFIIGRAIAGIGAAGIRSGNIIIVIHSVPLNQRPKYMGLMGAVYGVASIIGPLLGGVFTTNVSWRWCFYINLPIGGVTMLILFLILHFPPVPFVPFKKQIGQMDPLGTLCFIPSIICLLLALEWGGSMYAWSNARIIVLFVLAFVLFVAFVGIQFWKQENATVQPRIAANRTVALCMIYIFFTFGAMITIIYYLPLWFQVIEGVNATKSGIRTLPLILSLVVGSISAGITTTKLGWYNPFLLVCGILMAIGSGLLMTFKVNSSQGQWIGYQIVFGLGIGFGMQSPMVAVQAALPKKDIAVSVALLFVMMNMGGAVLSCVSQALFNNSLRKGIENIAGIDLSLVIKSGATDLRSIVPAARLSEVLKAYNHALTRTFIIALVVSALAFVVGTGIPWINVKGLEEGGQAGMEKREVERAENDADQTSSH